MERPTLWGVYDTQDNCWLGAPGDMFNWDIPGPKLFDDYDLARVAAQMVDMQMGWKPARTRAKLFDPTQELRLKDEVKTKMTPLDALKKMESGAL